jgi:spermidine synthase
MGYLFAHQAIQRFGIKKYLIVHSLLLILPLFFFPGRPLHIMAGETNIPLSIDVFLRLLTTIGPVFFVLSTISLVTQMWLSSSDSPQKNNPYFLYAVSNIGSLMALLTYPFYVEVFFKLSEQLLFWRILYGALIGLNIFAFIVIKVKEVTVNKQEKRPGVAKDWMEMTRWFVLGACGVVLFLSVTNVLTSEVAPVPLLWIIPLSIYLIAYILNFQKRPWCPSWIVNSAPQMAGWILLVYLLTLRRQIPVVIELFIFCFCLFALCMYVQNQLYRHKPKDDRSLTFYYVVISLGGFAGGVLVTWISPLVSVVLAEFYFGLLLVGVAWLLDSREKKIHEPVYSIRLAIYLAVFVFLWVITFKEYNFWGIAILALFFYILFKESGKTQLGLVSIMVIMLSVGPLLESFFSGQVNMVYRKRNYYGLYRVFDVEGVRYLNHGTTMHGAQFINPETAGEPIVYYARPTPIGKLMVGNPFGFKHVGVVGLGAGTMEKFLGADQEVDFYELDPDVLTLAKEHFTFLDNLASPTTFYMGDARISIEKNKEAQYDLLMMDAFGGDSIPFHLVNLDVIKLYRERLSEKGILLFHVSNRYIRLAPVLARIARELNAYYCFNFYTYTERHDVSSEWIAFTWNKATLEKLVNDYGWKTFDDSKKVSAVRLWTDDYVNILPFVKMNVIIQQLKNFRPFDW